MPRPSKIDIVLLEQMVSEERKTLKECAEYFSCSVPAVSKRLKELNISVKRNAVFEHAPEVVAKKLNAIEQLQRINQDANELLDLCMKWQRGDKEVLRILESQVRYVMVRSGENKKSVKEYKFKDPRELALKAMAEIRNQLGLQLNIFKTLYDAEVVRDFMKEIILFLAEIDPDLRNQFINKVRQRKELSLAISILES